MKRWLMGMIAIPLGLASTVRAVAQDYPTRPMTMIVPFPAGGATAPLDQQSPEALRAFQKAEAERWWPIIKASGIKAE